MASMPDNRDMEMSIITENSVGQNYMAQESKGGNRAQWQNMCLVQAMVHLDPKSTAQKRQVCPLKRTNPECRETEPWALCSRRNACPSLHTGLLRKLWLKEGRPHWGGSSATVELCDQRLILTTVILHLFV